MEPIYQSGGWNRNNNPSMHAYYPSQLVSTFSLSQIHTHTHYVTYIILSADHIIFNQGQREVGLEGGGGCISPFTFEKSILPLILWVKKSIFRYKLDDKYIIFVSSNYSYTINNSLI